MCTPGDRQARDLNPPGERRPDSEATCEAAGRRERTALMCVHGPAGPSSFHRGQCPRSQACPVAQAEAHAAGDAASGSAGGMIVRRKRAGASADIPRQVNAGWPGAFSRYAPTVGFRWSSLPTTQQPKREAYRSGRCAWPSAGASGCGLRMCHGPCCCQVRADRRRYAPYSGWRWLSNFRL